MSYLGTERNHTNSTPLYFLIKNVFSFWISKYIAFSNKFCVFDFIFEFLTLKSGLVTNLYEFCRFQWENIILLVIGRKSKWQPYPSIKSIWADFQTAIVLQQNIVTAWNFTYFVFLTGTTAGPNLEETWDGEWQIKFFVPIFYGITPHKNKV